MIDVSSISSGSSDSLLVNFCQDLTKNCLCFIRSWLDNFEGVAIDFCLRIRKGRVVCSLCNAENAPYKHNGHGGS